MMDKERLEEIKSIHAKIESAFEGNDSNVELHDLLTQLFEDYHTDWLIETVEEQQKLIAHWKKGFENENKIAGRLRKKFERLEKENDRLRETLRFYADEGNYVLWNSMAVSKTEIERDKGAKARQELGE